MSLRLAAIAVVAALALVTVGVVTPNPPRAAHAQSEQTDAMIWHFNVYRVQNSVPPLYTHPDISVLAQDTAQQNADACGMGYFPPKPSYAHKWSTFNQAGGVTADQRWPSWEADPLLTSRIADPEFTSVGVGQAFTDTCSQHIVWSVALGEVDDVPAGAYPTPTGPVTASPVPPTATQPNTTPTPTPEPTASATPAPTGTPTPSASASPTPRVTVNGDANCDGLVATVDGMLVLLLAADFNVYTPCLGPHGVDCTGLVDEFDVLAVFRYLSGVESGIPADCPPLGESTTPTPTAPPTVVPTPTAPGG